jgi:Pyridine nucleotide-disulphide oxidoreductase
LAQALARLGSEVTIVASRRLLPREEPEVSEILREIFEEEEGIRCMTGRISKVKKNEKGGGHIAVVTSDKEGDVEVTGDTLLLSIGRKPNTSGLGLQNLGIEVDPKTSGIVVNDKLETSCKGVYAAGDCTGDRQFTHYAGMIIIFHFGLRLANQYFFLVLTLQIVQLFQNCLSLRQDSRVLLLLATFCYHCRILVFLTHQKYLLLPLRHLKLHQLALQKQQHETNMEIRKFLSNR